VPPAATQTWNLDAAAAAATLDMLIAKAERLTKALNESAATLGGGAMQDPSVRGTMRELAATQGAIAGIRASVEQGGGVDKALVAGGVGAAVRAVGGVGRMDFAGAMNLLGGLDQPGIVSTPAGSFVQNVLSFAKDQQAQQVASFAKTAQFTQTLQLPIPGFAANTQGWQVNQNVFGPTMAMPAAAMPTQMYTTAQLQAAQVAGGGAGGAGGGAAGPAAIGAATTLGLARKAGMVMAGHAVAGAIGDWFNLDAQTIITGRPNLQQQGVSIGTTIGGIVGGIAGAYLMPGNPMFGAGLGLSVGAGLGGQIGGWWMAPEIQRESFARATGIMGAGMEALSPWGAPRTFLRPGTGLGSKLDRAVTFGRDPGLEAVSLSGAPAHAANLHEWAETHRNYMLKYGTAGDEQLTPTIEEIATTASGVFAALAAGGVNPMGLNPGGLREAGVRRIPGQPAIADQWIPGQTQQMMGWRLVPGRTGRTVEDSWTIESDLDRPQGQGGLLSGRLVDIGPLRYRGAVGYRRRQVGGTPDRWVPSPYYYTPPGRLIPGHPAIPDRFEDFVGGPIETNYQTYTRRIDQRYLRNAPEVMQEQGKLWAAQAETGDNIADILTRFGPTAAFHHAEISVEIGEKTPVSYEQLIGVRADVGAAGRRARLAQSMVRGGPAVVRDSFVAAQASVATLPGGKESEVYSELTLKRREAARGAFAESDALKYGIPGIQLAGAIERSEVLPFAPGNRFALEMAGMQMRGQQIQELIGRGRRLQSAGDLTVEDSVRMTQQIEELRTSQYRSLAVLSEGVENRLPALAAGTPAAFRRFNSINLAAFNLARVGSPIRSYGAASGEQQQAQDRFVEGFGMGGMPSWSKSEGLNSPDVNRQLERIATTLERIAAGKPGFDDPKRGNAGTPPMGGRTETGTNVGFNF
jgi:hypothetical protein